MLSVRPRELRLVIQHHEAAMMTISCSHNLLTLNVSKCKFVLYGSFRKLIKFQSVALTANGSSLERQESLKYLGVTINQNLSWSDHISNLSKKVNQRIGLIRRLKHLIPLKARIALFNSLVLPLFDYASIIWGDKNNAVLLWTTYRYCRIMQLGSYLICRALIRQSLKPWTN